MYTIVATIVRIERDGDSVSHQVTNLPTFYLNENVQGINSVDQAIGIARSVIDPFDVYGDSLLVTAVWIGNGPGSRQVRIANVEAGE